jgi:hypothetical protein
MARGWESKSVEDQIEAAQLRGNSTFTELTPEQAARLREVESLRLSRTRVLHDLEAAGNPRYRTMLMAALAHLDGKLADLEKV